MTETAEQTFSFAEFELNTAKRLLLRNGQPITLNSKTFDLLTVLVKNYGQILSKEELLERVWVNQFVEENNLSVQISALRKIFGEKKDEHQFIVTVPGTGYKFVAEVRQKTNNLLPVKTGDDASDKKQVSNIFDERTEIIGRAGEIAEIKDLLSRQTKCLITLTGAGGSGKTKLAQTIADEYRTEFAGDVFFIELAAVNRAELVIAAIAQALDVKESADRSMLGALQDSLRTRSVLIVLDNFEQLLSAVPLLKEIFDAAENLKLLVTSRAPLRLKSEREKTLAPLAVPSPNSYLSAEELSAYSAVELFTVRAQTARPNFTLNAENALVIAKICHKLDGLPLAIELAAARVKLLAPQAILTRLENSLNLLTGGARDLPIRQRTMRGAIEWSYELLDAEEKFLFRCLAVFAGGFTVEAAEAVCENYELRITNYESNKSKVQTLDLLDSLIDNNLLVQKELSDGNVRLRMLEVVREFALEMLRTCGEFDALRQIHAQFFLSLAEEAEPLLYGEKATEWFEKLENDHDNFRAALMWSLKNQFETAVKLTAALRFFWLGRGHIGEGLSWCTAALQVTENTVSLLRCKILHANFVFLKIRGELQASQEIIEKWLTESRELNNPAQILRANQALGSFSVLQKDYARAQIIYEESLALSRKIGDEQQTAYTLAMLGDVEMCKENYSAARSFFEECRIILEKRGEKPSLTTIFFNLGVIDYYEKLYDAAELKFAASLRICEEIGYKSMMSCALEGFAAIAAVSGNCEQSVKIMGGIDSLRESINYNNEPAEETFRADYLAKIRQALDEKAFAALYEQGKTMNLDESIALAKVFDPETGFVFDERETEIIIENHSFSRIIIEEEFED